MGYIHREEIGVRGQQGQTDIHNRRIVCQANKVTIEPHFLIGAHCHRNALFTADFQRTRQHTLVNTLYSAHGAKLVVHTLEKVPNTPSATMLAEPSASHHRHKVTWHIFLTIVYLDIVEIR